MTCVEAFAGDFAVLKPQSAFFERMGSAGIAVLVASIAMSHREDEARIDRASQALDDLYVYYQKKGR